MKFAKNRQVRRLGGAIAIWALAGASIGCSGTRDKTLESLDGLKKEVAQLRATQASLRDRLELVERETESSEAAADGQEGAAASSGRPVLEVVRLAPRGAESDAVVDAGPSSAVPVDDGPPVDIVGVGDAVKVVDGNAKKHKKPLPKRPSRGSSATTIKRAARTQ